MALAIGSKGNLVMHRQHQLHMLGYYHGKIDGIFGPLTQQAVMRFQSDHGLKPDGIIGPMTAAALDHAAGHHHEHHHVLRLGSTGPAVSMLQKKLKMSGLYTGRIDGIFGPLTDRAVREFQTAHGLVADGIVGPKTMAALMMM
ncbi:MAG TPA: peptidoglycan-binding protein [Verrucomicrobiae bacterium]|nr:peptidoglycan-binding protein [Verrucomicrobiae bacterium]